VILEEGGADLEIKQEDIHSKGFDMSSDYITDYGKIKVGIKTLEDAILDLSWIDKKQKGRYGKSAVLKALGERDIFALRDISDFFYSASGVYSTACNYFANLYRYDWYIVPEIYDETVSNDKIVKDFKEVSRYLDDSHVNKICGEIALNVIKHGCYYGYIVPNKDQLVLQELPINYCRSRYSIGGMPAVEFNMKFFDDKFRDPSYRMRVLKLFPDEFSKGYMLFKQGKLKDDFQGDHGGWYLLPPESTVKFNFNNSDIPVFANAIPAIIDLDAAQELDRRKQM
jgi:hypothetical protein